jgi:hypothetical protein
VLEHYTLGKLAAIITQSGQCFYGRELAPSASDGTAVFIAEYL